MQNSDSNLNSEKEGEMEKQISNLTDQEVQDDKLIDAIDQIEPIISKLSEEDRKAVRKVVLSQFKGPIPPPELLIEYNSAFNNGAERIFSLTEKEMDHSMYMQKTALNASIKHTRTGQTLGFILGLICLGLGGTLGYFDHDILAGTIVTTTILGLVGVFVLGEFMSNNKED